MNKKIKILLIEDNPGDARLVREFFKEAGTEFDLEWRETLSDGLSVLKRMNFDLILLDLSLPDSSGLETVEKTVSIAGNVPIIVLTVLEDEEIALKAMRKGAQDYLNKSFLESSILIRYIRFAIERKRLIADLELSNRELCESEKRLQSVIKKNADGIFVINNEGIIRFVNPAAKKMFRRSGKDLIGSPFGYPVIDSENSEIEIISRDAGTRIAALKCVKITWEGEDAYLVSMRDITEQKRTMEKQELTAKILHNLDESGTQKEIIEKILNLLKEFTGFETIGIRLKEGEDFPHYVTTGFPEHFVGAERYQCNRDESNKMVRKSNENPFLECMCENVITGKTNPAKSFFTERGSFWTNSTTELLATTSDDDRQARTSNRYNGEGYESVALIPLKTGKETIGLLQFNDKRKNMITLDMLHFFENISESIAIAILKKASEEALKQSEERFRELSDSIKDVFFAMDEDLRYTYWNAASEKLMGIKSEDAIGKSIYDVFPDTSETRRAVEEYRKVLETGKPRVFQNKYTLNEQEYYFELSVYPSQKGLCVIAKDISEKKRMEQMLLRSEKMASIGVLSAGIAHEINNPMGYIFSNLNTLLKYNKKFKDAYNFYLALAGEYLNSKSADVRNLMKKFMELNKNNNIEYLLTDMKDALEESLEGAERVKRIVADLKDFSRDEKPRMEEADINEGIEKTFNVIWNELKYKAEVVKKLGKIPLVECNIQKLERVFMNILMNAAQAIEEHGTITIKTMKKNDSVLVQISDTGKGIPEDIKGKIFDAFFTTKAPGKGTGIGLSITYKIVQEHGGSIHVDSEVGKGTTFTITLPIGRKDVAKDYKVLVVDDDDGIRDYMKSFISKYDPAILVKTAKNGFEAGDMLNSFNPDLVLLDVSMPGIDGIEVCRRIKEDKSKEDITVVMITGLEGDEIKEEALKAGAEEFIRKPFTVKDITGVLDRIMKK